jgi:hypothetical protein
MANPSKTQHRPSRAQRLVQFSLRGLLLLVAVCSVWLGIAFHRAREQARAVAAIKAAGGTVYYDYQQGADLYSADPAAESNVPAWLLDQFGVDFFHDVMGVSIANDAKVDDQPAINMLPDLLLLEFRPPITDARLRELKHLDKLQVLYLISPLFTDNGLAELRAMTKLEVTDDGLEHLKYLPNLRIVVLDASHVTREGAQALSDALPECLISIETSEGETFFVSPDPPPRGYVFWGCYP